MKNKHLSIVKEIMEVGFAKANLQIIDQYVSVGFNEHQFGGQNGKEGLIKIINQLHGGLSNIVYSLQRSTEDGDVVWTHYKATAVHSGQFMHMAPSNKKITIDIFDVFRFENGLLVEHWGVPDRFAAMMQIGVFKGKEAVS